MTTTDEDRPLSWTSGTKMCPRCGARFERSKRTRQDEWVSLVFYPVRRYVCRSAACGYSARLKAQTVSPGTWPGLLPQMRRHAFGIVVLVLSTGLIVATALHMAHAPEGKPRPTIVK